MSYTSSPVRLYKVDDGVGIESVETEFYLSTSKTEQAGGSWVDEMPTWKEGTYLWVRSVVTYTDGSITYTAPVCDSSWEAVNKLNEELDQTEVFNRLTNNGALQGLYMKDNQLYVNASYIKTGELLADLIKAGVITALNKTGGSFTINLNTGEIESVANGKDENGVRLAVILSGGNLIIKDKDTGEVFHQINVDGDGYVLHDMKGYGYRFSSGVAIDGVAVSLVGAGGNGLVLRYENGSGGGQIIGLATPTVNDEAANKKYVDDKVAQIMQSIVSKGIMTADEAAGILGQ